MLDQFDIAATLPASDIDRAKRWYQEKLGLTPEREEPEGVEYRCGSTKFSIYPSQFAGTAQNTAAAWEVDDIDKCVEALRANGVTLEEYDLPGLKTETGIAEMGGIRGAWFKDSEGNILAVAERRPS